MKKLFYSKLAAIIIVSLNVTFCNPMKQKVDMIVYNAKVYTADQSFSIVEAFAVNDGRFLALGSNHDIQAKFFSDKMINAEQKAVYPGFMDGHCHFFGYGENLVRYADLAGSKSMEEVIERLKMHQESFPSEWILGRGWDQNLWTSKEFPDNELLEATFPDRNVYLIRIDGHAALVSQKALDLAGINQKYKVQGGEIILNKYGKTSGVLLDNAMDAVRELIPSLTNGERECALFEAQQKCFEAGLTGVTDAGLPYYIIDMVDAMQLQNRLKMKMNIMINPDSMTMGRFFASGPLLRERLTVRSVKLYADGALGSRGAKLILPYSDAPGKTGLILNDTNYYHKICKDALVAGFQVNVHAIGDSANRLMLNIFGQHLKDKNDLRWRIEHAQVIDPDDFALFAKYSIIPSVQSTHCTSDMGWADERLGETRIKSAYAQKQLLEQNGWIVNGTDFPIESISPIKTFYAAVARKDADGHPFGGFQMENSLSRKEALYSITYWPAKGAFEEALKGSIEVSKYADFVILDQDIMQIDESDILKTRVIHTVVSGEIVY